MPDDDESDNDDDEESEDDDEDEDRMLGLPGIRGEAKVQMLSDDILQKIEEQRNGTQPSAMEDDSSVEDEQDDDDFDKDLVSLPTEPPVQRQTFVYSATLTLPSSHKSRRHKGVDGAIAEILDMAHVKGKTKVVDLSKKQEGKKKGKEEVDAKKRTKKKTDKFALPPGLTIQEIKCTQMHKDSHLYAYLMTQANEGPCLVFCNSIPAVRRVGETLQTLKLSVRTLHANMQQVCAMLS